MTDIIKVCKKHGELNAEDINKFWRCRLCKNESSKNYRATEKGKISEKRNTLTKRSRKQYRDKQAAGDKKRIKHYVNVLHNVYVKKLLKKAGFERDKMNEDIIELKKIIIKIDRIKRSSNANG